MLFSLIISFVTIMFPPIQTIRQHFKKAINSEQDVEWLLTKLYQANPENNPIEAAYLGAANILKAQYVFWPYSKLTYVNTGMSLINQAIKYDSDNAELRLIRFNMEDNIPSFVGYKEHLKTDCLYLKTFVQNSCLTNKKAELINDIVDSIKNSKHLTAEDKLFVKSINL